MSSSAIESCLRLGLNYSTKKHFVNFYTKQAAIVTDGGFLQQYVVKICLFFAFN